MSRRSRIQVRRRASAGLFVSLCAHGAAVVLSASYARSAPAQPELDFLLYPVDIAPPKGITQGDVHGTTVPVDLKGAAMARPASPSERSPRAASRHHVERDPSGEPSDNADKADKKDDPEKTKEEQDREEMREAVRKAMLAPPDAPVGSGTAAPLGVANGAPGSSGTGRPRMSPAYAGMLDGWFSSRMSLRGLNLPWEQLKPLRVSVSISISSERRVTAFSITRGSGNAAYDGRVQASMQSVVGAALPAPPEGEDPPSHFTLLVHCRSQESCS